MTMTQSELERAVGGITPIMLLDALEHQEIERVDRSEQYPLGFKVTGIGAIKLALLTAYVYDEPLMTALGLAMGGSPEDVAAHIKEHMEAVEAAREKIRNGEDVDDDAMPTPNAG